jgi:hypothetical protein
MSFRGTNLILFRGEGVGLRKRLRSGVKRLRRNVNEQKGGKQRLLGIGKSDPANFTEALGLVISLLYYVLGLPISLVISAQQAAFRCSLSANLQFV